MDDATDQLFCDEGSLSPVTVAAGRRSFDDPALRDDGRVLALMLRAEDSQPPATTGHVAYSQGNLQPSMRRVVVTWMLEVTDEQNCEEEVFPLSVIYLDQVVSVLTVRKACLQLVACVCMFIASKFRETNHLSANILVMYTDSAFAVDQLLQWELVVLEALRWNVSHITPHDILDHILVRLPYSVDQRRVIRRHAVTFIVLCITEMKFSATPSSMLAAGSVITAVNGLRGNTAKTYDLQLVDRLHDITSIETDCLRHCYELIDAAVRDSVLSCCDVSTSSPSAADDSHDDDDDDDRDSRRQNKTTHLPSTPTDVRDISLVNVDGTPSFSDSL